ncbi:hypothetical protein V492_05133, partial [Pseudogymnoascus sp. VKM F-4246]
MIGASAADSQSRTSICHYMPWCCRSVRSIGYAASLQWFPTTCVYNQSTAASASEDVSDPTICAQRAALATATCRCETRNEIRQEEGCPRAIAAKMRREPPTEEYTYRLSSILLSTPSLRADPKQIRILDLCTGTGCIPLLLLSLLSPTLKTAVTGIDISPTALALSRLNTTHNSPPLSSAQARFASGDVLASGAAVLDEAHGARGKEGWWYGDETFDVVTANPPYISRLGFNRDTERSVRNFEPRLALVPEGNGGKEGRPEDIFYEKIVERAEGVKARILLMEVAGTEQAGRVAR